MEKNYRIVARCDAYNARRHHHGEVILQCVGGTPTKWVMACHLSLADANATLLRMLIEIAERDYANWGLAVMNVGRLGLPIDAGTHSDGTRYLTYDTMSYAVEIDD